MKNVETTQRNATRNQSTVDFERKNLFLFGNRYSEAIFKNDTGAELVATAGILVMRDVNDVTKVIPATYNVPPESGNLLGNTIGILNVEGENTLSIAGEINCNVCISGDIDAGLLSLPVGVTLNTVVGTKILKDILTDLGFVLFNVTENSKFDN